MPYIQTRTLAEVVPAGHIRLKIAAAPINPADGMFVAGIYNELTAAFADDGKQTAGSELVGVVIAQGEGATKFAIGTRVYASCNFPNTGAWAQYIDYPEVGLVVPIPDGISSETACQLLVNPVTAIGFLDTIKSDGGAEGDYFLLTAANSSLAKMTLRINKTRDTGFKSIAIIRREEQKEALEKLADVVIVNKDGVGLTAAILEATGGVGVKAIFDAIGGGPVASAVIDALAPGSTSYVYGVLDTTPLTFNSGRICFKDTGVKGWWLGHFLTRKGAELPQFFGEIFTLLAAGSLSLPSKSFDLVTQWEEALKHSVTPGKNEKTVLVSK